MYKWRGCRCKWTWCRVGGGVIGEGLGVSRGCRYSPTYALTLHFYVLPKVANDQVLFFYMVWLS